MNEAKKHELKQDAFHLASDLLIDIFTYKYENSSNEEIEYLVQVISDELVEQVQYDLEDRVV